MLSVEITARDGLTEALYLRCPKYMCVCNVYVVCVQRRTRHRLDINLKVIFAAASNISGR